MKTMAVGFLAAAFLGAVGATDAGASTVLGLSLEDQARLSRMVVVGEVLSLRGIDDPTSGIETVVTLRVTDVLAGSARPFAAVRFRLHGGEVGGVVSEAIGEAQLSPGQAVMVFLEEIDGKLYNLGLSMGAWDVHEDATGARSVTRAIQGGLNVVGGPVEMGPLALDDVAARVSQAMANPTFDSALLRDARASASAGRRTP